MVAASHRIPVLPIKLANSVSRSLRIVSVKGYQVLKALQEVVFFYIVFFLHLTLDRK